LDGKDKMPDKIAKTKGLDEQLRMQDQIAHVMRAIRYQHGALELETIEPEAVLRDGRVVDLRVEKKNRAQELIEDFMIAANGVSAQFLVKHGVPALRRVVRSPERWDGIRKVAEGFGENLPTDPDSKALAAFLATRCQAGPAPHAPRGGNASEGATGGRGRSADQGPAHEPQCRARIH
jgi:exoribonuclease-2